MANKKNAPAVPAPPVPRRPLLSGGERLREPAERVRGPNPFVHPYSVAELQRVLRPQAQQLLTDIAATPNSMTGRHMIVEATLFPNYIAASHFPRHLLQAANVYPVGTRQSKGTRKSRGTEEQDVPTKTLLFAGSKESVASFARIAASDLSSLDPKVLEDIRGICAVNVPIPATVVTLPETSGDGEVITWEAVLTTIGRNEDEWEQWGDEAFNRWVDFIRKLSGDVDVRYRRTLGGVTFVPVSLEVSRVYDAAKFNLLRSIRPMPRIRKTPVSSKRTLMTLFLSPKPLDSSMRPRSDQRVALFDGGIDRTSPYFAPFVKLHDLTPMPPDESDLRHGSMVTSALLYGHIEGHELSRPECDVDHYRVLPLPPQHKFDDELCWFLDQIVSVVREKRHAYVLLAAGPDECVDDVGEPHRWTSTLDALANELGVVFVIAAGNNGAEDAEKGYNRVLVPSDMANGIGVGAYTNRSIRTRAKLQRARYSPVGPGRPGQRVQPVGLAFGGCEDEPFLGIDNHGKPSEGFGTSYAAPLAMRGVLGLSNGLGPNAMPATVRAFVAHFAEGGFIKGTKLPETGYGRLRESYADVWECRPNEVTVLYHDSMKRAQTMAMKFPFPAVGIDPEADIEILWTFCYMSEVCPAETADYTRSGFEVTFRPHERRRTLYDENREAVKDIDTLTDEAFARNYLATHGGSVGPTPIAAQGWGRNKHELEQRKAGKWETLSCGKVSLAAKDIYRPRLDLTYIARAGGVLVSEVPDLRTSLVVTIRAPQEVALYDLVREQFRVLVPLEQHTQIR